MSRSITALAAVAATVAVALSIASGAAAHQPHSPLEEDGAIRSKSMSLESSALLCPRQPDAPEDDRLENHGGDIAFWGDTAVLACGGDDEDLQNDGFVIVDISDPRHPQVTGRMSCVASASDIAIHGDLVFLAVDTNTASGATFSPGPDGAECNAPVRDRTPEVDEAFFAGVRIISIADKSQPYQIKALPTNPFPMATGGTRDRGAHGLAIVPDRRNKRLIVYSPNFNGQRQMDAIVVPLGAPETAYRQEGAFPAGSVVNNTNPGCHDIAIFLPRKLAACTSPAVDPTKTTETILYDISDPLAPKPKGRMQVAPAAGHSHHSATFSWDGRTLIVTDENAGALGTDECKSRPGPDQGVLWFYDVEDVDDPRFLATQTPHAVTGVDWCHPKQLNVVPLPSGDDVLVASWLGGGTTVVDFTDLNPRGTAEGSGPYEVAHYVVPRDALGPGQLPIGHADATLPWSSYWYNGHIYANNAWGCFSAWCLGTKTRGLDVFTLDFRRDDALDPAHRERLAASFDDALELPWFNSYVQDCVPPPLDAGDGSSAGHAACAPW